MKNLIRSVSLQSFALAAGFVLLGCSSDSPAGGGGGAGGALGTARANSAGGVPGTGGAISAGASGTGTANGGTFGGSGGGGGGAGAFGSGGANATGGSAVGGAAGGIGVGGNAGGGAVAGSGGTAAGGSGSGGTAGTGGVGGAGTAGAMGTAGASAGACVTGTPGTGGQTYSANSTGSVGNGYSYQYWSSKAGTGTMTVFGQDAKFSATWSQAGDFLARVGLSFSPSKPPAQIGTIVADFAETKSGAGGGYSYIGIYGWSENPLHEYYIVEDWFGSHPVPGTKVGTITVDGGVYDVLTHTQTDQPSVTGSNATFVQFWSVRQTARQCGHISISDHFSKWAAMNMQLGNLDEAKILVEAGNNSGSINFTNATVTLQ